MINKCYIKFSILLIALIFLNTFSAAKDTIKCKSGKKDNYTASSVYIGGNMETGGDNLHDVKWGKHEGFERVVFDMYYDETGKPADKIPFFFVAEYFSKKRIIKLMIMDIRKLEAASYVSTLSSDLIKNIQQVTSYDHAITAYDIKIKKGIGQIEFEMFYYENPARIVIDIRLKE